MNALIPPGLSNLDRKSRTALIAAVLSLFLTIYKLILASISSSIALKADAFHSASDVVVSLMVFSGLRFSGGKEQSRPWMENLVAIAVALMILYAAGSIFSEATTRAEVPLKSVHLAVIGSLISIAISGYLARYKIFVAKETSSPSLLADGYHSLVDSYSSVAVVVGLIGQMIGLPLDKLAASIVGLLVAGTGLEILTSSIKAILTGQGGRFTWMIHLSERVKAGRSRAPLEDPSSVQDIPARLIAIFLDLWSRRSVLLVSLTALIVLLIYLAQGIAVVGPGETGYIVVFGRVKGEYPPGLYYHPPPPFGKIRKIQPEFARRMEVGFRTGTSILTRGNLERLVWESRHRAEGYIKYPDEALMLTGDENLIDLTLVLQYHLSDPEKYLFGIKDPDLLVRTAVQAAVRHVVGNGAIDSLLTTRRIETAERTGKILQKSLDRCGSGIKVDRIWLREVHPPVEVVNSFREVASAREDRSRIINEAVTFKNGEIPRAQGEAFSKITGAMAYRTEKNTEAGGKASRFVSRAGAAAGNTSITRLRLFIETMEQVMPGLDKLIMEPGIVSGALDLRFLRETKGIDRGIDSDLKTGQENNQEEQ